MEEKGNTSRLLGIIGLSLGWFIPLVGIVLGTIGLSMKKGDNPTTNITLNILSIILGIFFWVFWGIVLY